MPNAHPSGLRPASPAVLLAVVRHQGEPALLKEDELIRTYLKTRLGTRPSPSFTRRRPGSDDHRAHGPARRSDRKRGQRSTTSCIGAATGKEAGSILGDQAARSLAHLSGPHRAPRPSALVPPSHEAGGSGAMRWARRASRCGPSPAAWVAPMLARTKVPRGPVPLHTTGEIATHQHAKTTYGHRHQVGLFRRVIADSRPHYRHALGQCWRQRKRIKFRKQFKGRTRVPPVEHGRVWRVWSS